MGRLFSKSDLRDLGLILALVMLLAGVPSTAGLLIVSGPRHPELTINICQPVQMLDRVSSTLLARPADVLAEFVLRDLGLSAVNETARPVDLKLDPDTPPPKRLV